MNDTTHELDIQCIRSQREYDQIGALVAKIEAIAEDCPAWLWDASHLACLNDSLQFLMVEWEGRQRETA